MFYLNFPNHLCFLKQTECHFTVLGGEMCFCVANKATQSAAEILGQSRKQRMAFETFSWFSFTFEHFLFLPQGYEHVHRYAQRPSALGLQAAGRKGLQHAPHRVKGKKHNIVSLVPRRVCVQCLLGNFHNYMHKTYLKLISRDLLNVSVVCKR